MSSVKWVGDAHYAYTDPGRSLDGEWSRRTLFWRERLVAVNDSARKTFRSITANPDHPGWYTRGFPGPPEEYGFDSRGCLFRLADVRRVIPPDRGAGLASGGVVLLTEGEKDALSGRDLLWEAGVPGAATSHHGGACKFTEEQAAHFAPLATVRGRRSGIRVWVVVDRDDAGYADGLRRVERLLDVGLRMSQLRIRRPADGVVAGGGCGTVGTCTHEPVCPLPENAWEKADLTDHANAGLGLAELVRVPLAELRAGAERYAALRANGWAYGAPELDPDTAAAIAENKRLHDGRFVWGKARRSA